MNVGAIGLMGIANVVKIISNITHITGSININVLQLGGDPS